MMARVAHGVAVVAVLFMISYVRSKFLLNPIFCLTPCQFHLLVFVFTFLFRDFITVAIFLIEHSLFRFLKKALVASCQVAEGEGNGFEQAVVLALDRNKGMIGENGGVHESSRGYPLVVSTWPFVDAVRAGWEAAQNGYSAIDAVVEGCSACEELRCDGTGKKHGKSCSCDC